MKSGDIMAEIETDKATMEFEAVDEGVVTKILVAEGTDNVKVGTVIMTLKGEDDSDDDGERAGDAANAQPKEDQPADKAPPAPESNTPHQVETGARQMFEAAKHDAEIADPAIPAGTEMVKTTLREALRDAMAEEMRRDDRVFVMGEEVAQYQGAYKVTQGLLDEFGDTPRHRYADHRIWLCRGRHRRGDGRAAADRRVHDVQLRDAGDRPHRQFGGEDQLYVGRPDALPDRVPRAPTARHRASVRSIRRTMRPGMPASPG